MPTAPSVFISYSHRDEVWKDRLLTHLRISEKEGLLELWDDRRISAGTEWRPEIEKAIDAADIGILLISADFLVSEFIRGQEIPRMLERRSKNGMRLFPVMVRSCDWQIVPWLAPIQIRPTGARPLADFRGDRRDSEMAAIAREVRGILDSKAAALSILPTLHQLPTPPADFTGREDDLDFLRSKLAQGGTGAIFGLRGMGGVGKTTLALKLADELKLQYPDAQIYLDLKGVDPQPLTPAQAMAHVIRAFHPEARLPESEAELAGLYRSVLNNKNVLLLIDNAAGKEQVEPLIPPSTCLLLVTSRFRFALPGLVSRDLDEMPEEDAKNLLLRIAPRIGDAADEIARLCGRLALALRLAGSALAERQILSPAEYARRLREGREKLEPVEAALRTSYNLLTEERRRLWRLLAVFSETFDGAAAATVWNLENDDAGSHLEELVRSSLIEWENKDERYRLHDLAHAFAEEQITIAEEGEGQRRHAEHFLETLLLADSLFEKGGEESLVGLALFDREWSNIRAGQAWSVVQFHEGKEAADLCSSYPDAGAYCLILRHHPKERIQWLEVGLAAARHLKDRYTESAHLGNLGLAYVHLGNAQSAIEFYEQQLTISRKIAYRHEESNALGNLGRAYWALGKTRRALEFHEQYLMIAREIGDRRGEGNALGNLGVAYAALGETRRSIELYEQQLTIVREIGDRRSEGNALGNLGVAYKNLGEIQRAIEFCEERLQIAREIRDQRGEGNAFGGLGLAYAALGDNRRAIEFYEKQLTIVRKISDRRGEAKALGGLGPVHAALGETQIGIELCRQALIIDQEICDRRGEASDLGNLGRVYAALGETARAIEFFEEQLIITREIGDQRGEGNASWNLGLALEREGDLARAAELMQILVDYERENGHMDTEKHAAEVEALRARIAAQKS
ncbi:MAG TPA: tetratricopeptide repeat protein [Thermoanaerobaculia bacterium]|jgi:tetratricopeptide (TPR) repeat protein